MNVINQSAQTLSLLKAGKLQGCTNLKLKCDLTEFPAEIFTLANTLEILDLSGNRLKALPDELHKLHKMRVLFCSSNQFTHLPEVLGKCINLRMIGFKANKIKYISENAIPTQGLRWLILTDNALTNLPNVLGDCTHMQKLMLSGNQLNDLPKSLANCKKLELLRISANQLKALPEWLFNLPNLSWLAYAGNPLSDIIEDNLISNQSVKPIDWQTITLQKELGQGASGVIYQAIWHPTHQMPEPVAVKLFKSELTSDGLPSCEISANSIAGQHPNLIGLKGTINNHPQGKLGLVMTLLPPDLKVLANPPSFESCTRDVYPKDLKLTIDQVKHIIKGVTLAIDHLHARGLMHGDLYAHNILWSPNQVILSDLGGASFLPLKNITLTQKILQFETRALEILVQELMSLTEVKNSETSASYQDYFK